MNLLLVEDEARIADFVKRGVTAEGWTVEIASDAETAFDILKDTTFDVILLDLMLPGMSGLDLCEKLRQTGNETPILMLTALGDVQDKITGLQTGADDYLTKPFDFEELLARIRALARRKLRRATPTDVNIITIGGLSIDRDAMTLHNRGQPVDLSPKEWDLLLLLVTNQNKVLSREQILQDIWNTQDDPMTNIVDVYIARLRRKIAPYGDLIATVRGAGYRCDAPV